MYNAFFAGTFDITSLVLGAFTLFFIGLIIYLRREDRREGYPLEDDMTGRREATPGALWYPSPKTFKLMHGEGTVSKPDNGRDSLDLAATRSAKWSGAPLVPSGDPLTAGVGPGAYVNRANRPDRITTGEVRIVPMRIATDFFPAEKDPDPRGMTVVGADNATVGTVTDIWIDRADYIVRYFEVTLAGGDGRKVLLPGTMADIQENRRRVKVDAILGSQFANVPPTASPDQITLAEEDRIMAYYGAGLLYATPSRAEPLL